MSNKGRDILSHAGVYLAARGLPGVVAFLAIPLFSRLLDPAGYGRYALVMAGVNVANALLFQWLRLSLVRYLPACGGEPARLKSTLATVSGGIILILGVVALAACLLPLTAGSRLLILLGWLTLAAQAAFEMCCEYARGDLQPWHFMRLQLARAGAFVGLGVAFVIAGAGWWGPLAGVAVGMTAAAVFAWRRDWSDARPAIDRELLAKVSLYGIPLSLTVALTVVIASSDRYLIAWLMNDEAAGLYSVAADFTTQTLTLLMVAVNMAAFPLAVRAWEAGGAAAARERMATNASLLLAVGVPCLVGLGVLAPGIANVFLGKSYRLAAGNIIPIVAFGTFLAGFKAFHFDAAFQFAHRTLWQVWIVLFAAVVNLALNVLAIPRWGIQGAAGASVAAYLIAIALTIFLGRRHVALPVPAGAAAKVALAAGTMGLVLYPLRGYIGAIAVAAQVVAGGAVYALVLLASDFMELRTHLLSRWTHVPAAVAPEAA